MGLSKRVRRLTRRARKTSVTRRPIRAAAVLTQRELIFARHFATSGDPMRAAMSSGIGRQQDGGWDVELAREEGQRLLQDPTTLRYIADLTAQDSSWTGRKVDAEKVHAYLDCMLATTPYDFFIEDESGRSQLKPPHLLDDAQRSSLKKIKHRKIFVGGEIHHEVEVELFDKTKVLAIKAKILGMLDGAGPVNPDEAAFAVRTALKQIELTDGDNGTDT